MTFTEYIRRVAHRSGSSNTEARRVLDAAIDILQERLSEGDSVSLRGVGTFDTRLRQRRTIRSVNDSRKIVLGEVRVPRFRPAAALRRASAGASPMWWKDPRHQAAWRLAETLVSDLQLYHRSRLPANLQAAQAPGEVDAACEHALGALWRDARSTWTEQIDPDIRSTRDHLIEAALRHWTGGSSEPTQPLS